MISELQIENLTAFENLQLKLSPKLNVIIGSNGTGKTHILKAIYGLSLVGQPSKAGQKKSDVEASASKKFVRIFTPEDVRLGALHSKGTGSETRLSLVNGDGSTVEISFNSRSKYFKISETATTSSHSAKPIFIPAKEVLSLVRGMRNSNYDRETVEAIFDDGYTDLAELLVSPGFEDEASRVSEDPRLSAVIRELGDLVGGRYRWTEEGAFHFEPGHYEEIAAPDRTRSQAAKAYQDSTVTRFIPKEGQTFSSAMTAEGYRKIGVLHRLLCNGAISPGKTGVLLWDEPEANLNPKLMKKVVQILLELSRNGQQVVVATHDYVLLKWFDLLKNNGLEDHIRFHVLARDEETGSISVHSTDEYDQLAETGIAKTFGALYDAEIERSLEGVSL